MLIVNQNRKLVLNLYCRIVRLTKKEEKKKAQNPSEHCREDNLDYCIQCFYHQVYIFRVSVLQMQ